MPKYAKLKSLVSVSAKSNKATTSQLKQAANKIAHALRSDSRPGRFRVVMMDKSRKSTVDIDHGSGKSKVTNRGDGKPNFEICGSRETLTEIAAGRLSPADAYLTGRLEVRGDLDYGKRIYARTADRGRREL